MLLQIVLMHRGGGGGGGGTSVFYVTISSTDKGLDKEITLARMKASLNPIKSGLFRAPTINDKIHCPNGKIWGKIAFPRYTERVKFRSQSRETASKRKPYRGLGTR